MIEIPSSQFYSPFQSVGKYLSIDDRVAQAIAGLNAAAKQKKVYHLWTHPFNMGQRTDELMGGLQRIFEHFKTLQEDGKIESQSMRDFTYCGVAQ